MTDPRKQPGFKQKCNAEKIELLLGAILDALLPQVVEEKPPEREVKRRKGH